MLINSIMQIISILSLDAWVNLLKKNKDSHSVKCLLLTEVCVRGAHTDRANQELQVKFITAPCVCVWRRHAPLVSLRQSYASNAACRLIWESLWQLFHTINSVQGKLGAHLRLRLRRDVFEWYLMQYSWKKCWHSGNVWHQTRLKANRRGAERGRREGLRS